MEKSERHSANGTESFPHFVVIGAMKSGTTTLYQHLLQHPELGMSRMKETDFFVHSMNYPLGFSWYRRLFPSDDRLCGEVSPNYTKHDLFKGVPARIAEAAPEAKFIFLARDPVDRFVSHYRHSWLLDHSRVPPDELMGSSPGDHMLECSRYAAQIRSYLEYFHQDRFLILDFDELRKTPQRTLDRVTDFLGVARHPLGEVATANDAGSLARMPVSVQRVWRSRPMRALDPLVTRGMRDLARRALARGPERTAPEIGPELRRSVATRLSEDAQEFRTLSGLSFPSWSV